MIQVKQISTEETYEIRKNVLRRNISLTEKNEDDFSDTALHFGGFINGQLVSVATFMQGDSQYFKGFQYRLRSMATLDDYQGQGFGKSLILESVKVLKEMNVEVLWCTARIGALKFYQKLGFKTIGTEFDIHLIGPHYVMYINI